MRGKRYSAEIVGSYRAQKRVHVCIDRHVLAFVYDYVHMPITYCDEGFLRVTSYSRQELIGRNSASDPHGDHTPLRVHVHVHVRVSVRVRVRVHVHVRVHVRVRTCMCMRV